MSDTINKIETLIQSIVERAEKDPENIMSYVTVISGLSNSIALLREPTKTDK